MYRSDKEIWNLTMERLKSLILLLLVKSGTANKAGRLILRSNHDTDQTISIMTECKCNKGDEMSFSVRARHDFQITNDLCADRRQPVAQYCE